jgi:hypothetical protein
MRAEATPKHGGQEYPGKAVAAAARKDEGRGKSAVNGAPLAVRVAQAPGPQGTH